MTTPNYKQKLLKINQIETILGRQGGVFDEPEFNGLMHLPEHDLSRILMVMEQQDEKMDALSEETEGLLENAIDK